MTGKVKKDPCVHLVKYCPIMKRHRALCSPHIGPVHYVTTGDKEKATCSLCLFALKKHESDFPI